MKNKLTHHGVLPGTTMAQYEFSLILDGDLQLTDATADKLLAAGCSDGSPGRCEGVFAIDFHRRAASLEAAIQSAVADVERTGYRVAMVEMDAHAVPQPA